MWKKTLGSSLQAAGIAIFGSGGLTLLNNAPKWATGTLIGVGIACNVLGTFFAHLWAADTSAAVQAGAAIDAGKLPPVGSLTGAIQPTATVPTIKP